MKGSSGLMQVSVAKYEWRSQTWAHFHGSAYQRISAYGRREFRALRQADSTG